MSNSNRSGAHRADRDPITGAPGHRTGDEAVNRYAGKTQSFDDVGPERRAPYKRSKAKSRPAWDDARSAARAAGHRLEQFMPGDLDNDGL